MTKVYLTGGLLSSNMDHIKVTAGSNNLSNYFSNQYLITELGIQLAYCTWQEPGKPQCIWLITMIVGRQRTSWVSKDWALYRKNHRQKMTVGGGPMHKKTHATQRDMGFVTSNWLPAMDLSK